MMIKNNRDKGYSVRCSDDELINIGEAKEKLELKKRKIAELRKLQKEIGEWTVI